MSKCLLLVPLNIFWHWLVVYVPYVRPVELVWSFSPLTSYFPSSSLPGSHRDNFMQKRLVISLYCLYIFHKLKRKWIFILTSSFTYTLVGVSSLYISNNTFSLHYLYLNYKSLCMSPLILNFEALGDIGLIHFRFFFFRGREILTHGANTIRR